MSETCYAASGSPSFGATSQHGAVARGGADAIESDPRRLYRSLAAAVSVVTVGGPDGPIGMTASSVTAVSLSPPLLAVTLRPDSQTLAALRASGGFGINVLGEHQQALSARFAGSRPGWARSAGVHWEHDAAVPLLADVVAVAVCTLDWDRVCGDRVLVVGRIEQTRVHDGARPLVWHGSAYHGLSSVPVHG